MHVWYRPQYLSAIYQALYFTVRMQDVYVIICCVFINFQAMNPASMIQYIYDSKIGIHSLR